MDRYARQRSLADVGDSGQDRIARKRYALGGGSAWSSELERDYLWRAGARDFADPREPSVAFAHAAVFRNAAARELAEGAWRALTQIKSALEQIP